MYQSTALVEYWDVMKKANILYPSFATEANHK